MEPEIIIENLINFQSIVDEDVDQDSEEPQSLALLSWSKKNNENTDENKKFADSGCQAFNELGLWVNPAILEEEEEG